MMVMEMVVVVYLRELELLRRWRKIHWRGGLVDTELGATPFAPSDNYLNLGQVTSYTYFSSPIRALA